MLEKSLEINKSRGTFILDSRVCVRGTVLTSNLPTQLTQISPFMRLSDKDCVSGNNILWESFSHARCYGVVLS